METDPLFVLIPQEGSSADTLERFIADVLHQGGVWDTPRVSDGISTWRVAEHGATRVRLAGRIWEIPQEFRSFWLDLEREGLRPEQVKWTLYFDSVPGRRSPRRASDAIDIIEVPEQADWRVTLMGIAKVQDGMLVVRSLLGDRAGNR